MAEEELVGKGGHDMQSNDFACEGKESEDRDDKASIEGTFSVVV
jgi:hypothetical protein